MTALSVGDIVRCGVYGDLTYVVRAPAARRGWYFLFSSVPHLPTPVTRIARAGELKLIRKESPSQQELPQRYVGWFTIAIRKCVLPVAMRTGLE